MASRHGKTRKMNSRWGSFRNRNSGHTTQGRRKVWFEQPKKDKKSS